MKLAIFGGLTFATFMAAFYQQPLLAPLPMFLYYSLSRTQSLEKIHASAGQFQPSQAILQQFEQSQGQVSELEQQLTEVKQRLEAFQKRSADWDIMQQQLAALQKAIVTPKGRGRVAIFIDGANLYYMRQELKIAIDFKKLLELLIGNGTLWKAFYYTGIDSTNSQEQNFITWLRHNGFQVVKKELVKRADGSKKANLDVEMAMDIRDLASHYDTAILVGGDGDLACALEHVTRQGVRVEVLGLRSMTSEALINVADCYTDLAEVKRKICKQ